MAEAKSLVGGYDAERFDKEVDSKLLCPECKKVFKDPVQCPNEHYFCRSCIGKYLHEKSKTCPTCRDDLTEETLSRPPRLLTSMLQCLKIQCDHANRGCGELIELEFLDRHVENCGYSPTPCTNPGCSEVINKEEHEKHEYEDCCFRMTDCDVCKQQVPRKSIRRHPCFMRKEMDNLINDVKEIKEEVKKMKQTQEQFVEDLCRKMAWDQKDVNSERCELFTGKRMIFVCGGQHDKNELNSVESYNWHQKVWTIEPPMQKARTAPSAFIYEQQIYVAGGGGRCESEFECTDSIESLNVGGEDKKWIESPVVMPVKCNAHQLVYHKNSAILTGGLLDDNTVSKGIYEVGLKSSNPGELLGQMPEPRCDHGCDIIDDQVVITGGISSTFVKDAKDTVYAYDINTKTCKTLSPLPFPISDMATVAYRGNVILIGGINEKRRTLNTVVMYNVRTGKIKMLPRLNHKRAASAAVIVGNVIIVMGGYDYDNKTFLDSVEYLDLNLSDAWKELPPMTTPRGYASAVTVSVP